MQCRKLVARLELCMQAHESLTAVENLKARLNERQKLGPRLSPSPQWKTHLRPALMHGCMGCSHRTSDPLTFAFAAVFTTAFAFGFSCNLDALCGRLCHFWRF